VIRAARSDDVGALAALELRARRWACGDLADETALPALEELEAGWRDDVGQGTWVDDDGERVYGVVRVAADVVTALHVEPAAQGGGLGSALHDHAVTMLRLAGYGRAEQWVFAADGHTREFLARRGWRPDGERRESVAPQLRMVLEL